MRRSPLILGNLDKNVHKCSSEVQMSVKQRFSNCENTADVDGGGASSISSGSGSGSGSATSGVDVRRPPPEAPALVIAKAVLDAALDRAASGLPDCCTPFWAPWA